MHSRLKPRAVGPASRKDQQTATFDFQQTSCHKFECLLLPAGTNKSCAHHRPGFSDFAAFLVTMGLTVAVANAVSENLNNWSKWFPPQKDRAISCDPFEAAIFTLAQVAFHLACCNALSMSVYYLWQ